MTTAAELARSHWNETPLFLSAEERYRIYPWLYKAAEFRHHAGHKVLEIGCGTGCDLLQFAKHGAEAYGIDITEEHLRLAKQRVGDLANVRYSDARSIPFPDATFDYVYSHGVIHHSDEPQRIAAEILRVLKPGARFNVHVYSLLSLWPLYKMILHGGKWREFIENSHGPVHIDLYTKSRVRKLFSGIPLSFSKYHAPCMQWAGRWIGWFLVAKGEKPGQRRVLGRERAER